MIDAPTHHHYLDAQGWGSAGHPLAFAHRGGAEQADLAGLENTLVAFAHAVEQGYTYLETDVHVTADGVLVAFHDTVLDRVTDATGVLVELPWSVVEQARVGGREPIPSFADLVEAFPRARFNIDIKADGAVAPLARFLAERQIEDRVLVGSFSGRRLREFRRITGGRVATSASPLEVAAWVLLPGSLADRLTRGQVAALQIPHRHERLLVASARLVRKAHRRGKHVHVWTIDDPEEMQLLLDRGVDGLMTDRTDLLKDVLIRRGQWHEQ